MVKLMQSTVGLTTQRYMGDVSSLGKSTGDELATRAIHFFGEFPLLHHSFSPSCHHSFSSSPPVAMKKRNDDSRERRNGEEEETYPIYFIYSPNSAFA